jgi:hypothetical protein
MTGFFILNFIFCTLVVLAIVAGLAWSIATSALQSLLVDAN